MPLSADPARMNHVFVDFENVPSVDLSAIGDKPVEVTLLIGEKQRRLDLRLVRQIHEHATKVTLIEVGASGRNALDLVLAWHLGKTSERHSEDTFFVVSKDRDFDPLLAHLRARGLRVARVESFSALPFLAPPPRKEAAARRTASSARVRGALSESPLPDDSPTVPAAAEDRLGKLINRLQHKTKARPVRRRTLLSHIRAFYGNDLTEAEAEAIVATLEQRTVITVDERGRVTYPPE